MENDIDVYVHASVAFELAQLADIYGIGFYFLQSTPAMFNICVQYEADKEQRIAEFIGDVNKIKQLNS